MRFKNILRDYGRDFKNYLKIPFESTLPQHTGLIDKQRLLFTEDENKSYLGKSNEWLNLTKDSCKFINYDIIVTVGSGREEDDILQDYGSPTENDIKENETYQAYKRLEEIDKECIRSVRAILYDGGSTEDIQTLEQLETEARTERSKISQPSDPKPPIKET